MAVDVTIARLVTHFEADISDTRREMRKLKKVTQDTTGGIERQFSALGPKIKGAFAGAFAAVSAGALLKQLVDINIEFDALEARLRTLTKGDAPLAKRAFEELAAVAGELPFTIDQTIDAFARLGLQGFVPTAREIRAFANVAAAIGTQGAQSLKQVIEAIADASAGNFNERLQELSISAKVSGDKVRLSLGEVAMTVKKGGRDVLDFFRLLGETKFAGAAEERMKGMEGALSNLSDAFSLAARDIGESGFNEAIAEAINSISGLVRPTAGVGIDIGKSLWNNPLMRFIHEGRKFFRQIDEMFAEMKEGAEEVFAPMEGDIIGAKDAVEDLAKKTLSAMEEIARKNKAKETGAPTKEEMKKSQKESKRLDDLQSQYNAAVEEIKRIRERQEPRFAEQATQIQGETFALGGARMRDKDKERERDRDSKRLIELEKKVIGILEKIFKSIQPSETRTISEMG